jgi:tetratricopeptide repeat protein
VKWRAWILVGLGVLGSASARAEDDNMDAAADARFKEGVALAKQGKYDQARGSFLQTLALSPGNPKVLLNLAISEHGAGRFVDALGHLKAYLASPKVDPKKAQEVKSTLYDELWKATGHLRIQADRGESVLLDSDGKLGNAPLADVVDVAPGHHRVAAGSRNTEVSVAAGETKDVQLAAESPGAPVATTSATPPLTEPPRDTSNEKTWGTGQFVGLGVAGAGLIGLGLGVGFAMASSSGSDKVDRLEQETGTNGERCAGGSTQCRDDLEQQRDERDRNSALATGFLVGGGIALAAGAVMFFAWPKATAAKTAGIQLLPRASGFALRF